MGYSSYSKSTMDFISTYARSATHVDDIFTSNKTKKVASDMDPKGLKVRECRDSATHPRSLGVLFGLDETGSMGDIPVNLIKNKLGTMIETMLAHGVVDPSILFMGVGDHHSDRYPCQVGQFESGAEELSKWLTSVYLEGNGGGQDMESYLLAWYVGARHTSMDCFEKRGRKGYLFTVGDERTHPNITSSKLRYLFGPGQYDDVTAEQLLAEAQVAFNVYHIHVNSTRYKDDPNVIGHWRDLLGQNLIIIDDADNVAEVVASTIAIMEGANKDAVLSAFDPSVSSALININSGVAGTSSDVITF